jgi:hypothetical protein
LLEKLKESGLEEEDILIKIKNKATETSTAIKELSVKDWTSSTGLSTEDFADL